MTATVTPYEAGAGYYASGFVVREAANFCIRNTAQRF